MRYKEILLELNVTNIPDIDQFVSGATDRGRVVSPVIQTWYKKQVRNWLINNEDLSEPYQPKPNDPEWMQNAIDRGEELVEIVITPQVYDQLDHIMDWLIWLTQQDNVEAKRILQKLPKLTVPVAAQKSAQWTQWLNKQTDKIIGKDEPEFEEGIVTVLKFNNGFRIVKLEKKSCFSREGKLMQHCVGSYGPGNSDIFSLRDPQNVPHVTIEIQANKIVQIKGKQNRAPIPKYIPFIKEFIKHANYEVKYDQRSLGMVTLNGQTYDVEDMDNWPTTIEGNADLWNLPITELPANFKVKGSLNASNTQLAYLPDDLIVGGDLNIGATHITELPVNFKVGRNLIISNSRITRLPDGLIVNGNLNLSHAKRITHLPDGLIVNGNLNLSYSSITELPDNLKVGANLDLQHTDITTIPGRLVIKDLDVSNTKVEHLPNTVKVTGKFKNQNSGLYQIGNTIYGVNEIPDGTVIENFRVNSNRAITKLPNNFTVTGYCNISETKITHLPKNMTVGKDFSMTGTSITEIPHDLRVGGRFNLSNSKVRHFPRNHLHLNIENTPIRTITVRKLKDLHTTLDRLPDNLTIEEHLWVTNPEFNRIPKNLTVGGSLVLDHTSVDHIPMDLKVGGNLSLAGTRITEIPDGLEVGGSLRIQDTKVTRLPNNLKIGDLNITGTSISTLPDGLKMRRLDLEGNVNITKLPDNFTVESLSLWRSKVRELPKNLTVTRFLNLQSVKWLDTLPKDLKVGGELNIDYSNIMSFPRGFQVGGNLDLRKSYIDPSSGLPYGFKVGGNLTLKGLYIVGKLPNNMRIDGSLDLKNTSLNELPKNLTVGGSLFLTGTNMENRGRKRWADEINLKVRGSIYAGGIPKSKDFKAK